jgi:hypothetical protein
LSVSKLEWPASNGNWPNTNKPNAFLADIQSRQVVGTQLQAGHSTDPTSHHFFFKEFPMTLSERLSEYVRACFTGLWIQSFEHEDALTEIAQLCRQEQWRVAMWDIDHGLQVPGKTGQSTDSGGNDPLAAIRSINALASADGSALLVLTNFHRFLNSAEIVQALASQITAGKQQRTFIVILSPVVQIPTELEKLFAVIEHDLPDRAQLEQIARGIATEEGELPDGERLATVLDAAAGLTRFEAENAFSLSLVRHRQISPDAVWELKSQTLKKSGLLQLHRGNERFADLGGLESLKSFCLRATRRQQGNSLVRPRGVLLLSPAGCGKSQFCKALGNEIGRPTVAVDIGRLMGSLVGQSQANMRQTLHTLDAMAPVVAFFDEIEKGWKGVAGSGQSDGGTTSQMFGEFLTWANDHESDVYVVCTANDISSLPPEFSRAERFDATFFIDFPGAQERRTIWNLYIKKFNLDANQHRPVDANWTGAEIRACCRLAALLDVPLVEAAQNVVPVSVTAAESVERLRTWASGRCLSADVPEIYNREPILAQKPGRRVSRDPSSN